MSNEKNIAFFTTSLKKGGAERVVSILTSQLAEEYNVTLFLLYSDIEYKISEKVKIVVLNFRGFNFFNSIFLLNKTIKNSNISQLITFLYRPSFIALILRQLLNWKVKLIVSERTYTLSHYNIKSIKGRIGLMLVKWLYNKADIIMPNSQLTAYSLKNDLGIKTPIHVCYNPISNEIKSSVNSMKNEKVLNILSVGNNFWYKDQKIILEALSIIAEYDWKLTILGRGPLNLELRNLAATYKIDSKVEFIENVIADEYYQKFDLYISTSLIEGFPNTIVEAMMNGLAVISTDCKSGPREIIAPNTSIIKTLEKIKEIEYSDYGVLIPVSNPNLLTKTIISFLLDKELLYKYKKLSKTRSEAFKINNIMNEFKRILNYEK